MCRQINENAGKPGSNLPGSGEAIWQLCSHSCSHPVLLAALCRVLAAEVDALAKTRSGARAASQQEVLNHECNEMLHTLCFYSAPAPRKAAMGGVPTMVAGE